MKRLFRRRVFLRFAEMRGIETTKFQPHGVDVVIPKGVDDGIRYQLTRGRIYEEPEARLVKTFLKPGMPVVELGGSLGVISALIRSVIGADAQHIIVEANPALIDTCRSNAIGETDGSNTKIVRAAVDYSGNETVTFANSPRAHIGMVSRDGKGITVPASRFRDVVAKLDADRFALVCDIEGMEADLFEKERDLLSRMDVIVVETHPNWFDDGQDTVNRIIGWCEEAGLKLIEHTDHVLCLVRPD